MRITTEVTVRGELLRLELSDQDFCPECCGTLHVAGTPARPRLQCTSCYLQFRPVNQEAGTEEDAARSLRE